MSKEAILKIAAQDHDISQLHKEMEIFPQGRNFIEKVKRAGETNDAGHTMQIKEKVVKGGMIVREHLLPSNTSGEDKEMRLTMVTFYDNSNRCYMRWVVTSDSDRVIEFRGISASKSHSIAWARIDKAQQQGDMMMIHEVYTKTSTTSLSSSYSGEELNGAWESVITKVK